MPLPRRQQRALLAVLALHAGEIVSTDRLVEDLWGSDAPRSALGSLQNAVSSLRKVVGSDALLTEPPGYRLALEPEAVDALRFERLVEEARAAPVGMRGGLFAEALGLWRGPALDDLAFEPFAGPEIARLEGLRLGPKRSGSPESSASASTTGSCRSSRRSSRRTRSATGCAGS